MSWTDERMAAALSTPAGPDADEAFWVQLRNEMATRDATTIEFLPPEQPMDEIEPLAGPSHRGRRYLAVAAAFGLVVAGLYGIERGADRSPANAPTRGDIVLTDPMAVSLDDLPRTAAQPAGQTDYVVPDLTKLPTGWTATETTAFGLIWPPDNGYRNIYSLQSPSGASYSVDVFAGVNMIPSSGTHIDINGHNAVQSATQVAWEEEPGVDVTLSGVAVAGSTESSADIVNVARRLAFTKVRELPLVTIDPAFQPLRLGAQFAGTLGGVHYVVVATTGGLRDIWVSVGDQGSIGGVGNDRLSQPTDDPETSGGVNIAGVPGYGSIAFGFTVPAAAALRANLADGTTVQVPVLRNPGETYFALPIPLGVEITTLDFLDDAGVTVRSAVMPNLPAYFGACCANAPWTTDLERVPPPTTGA